MSQVHSDAQKEDQDSALEDFIADSDTGGRQPDDAFGKAALWYIPLVWSLYQLWIASPLPFHSEDRRVE